MKNGKNLSCDIHCLIHKSLWQAATADIVGCATQYAFAANFFWINSSCKRASVLEMCSHYVVVAVDECTKSVPSCSKG